MWIALYCIVYVAYFVFTMCVVFFTDKFHVHLSHDKITDLRNDINMSVCMYVCMYSKLPAFGDITKMRQ